MTETVELSINSKFELVDKVSSLTRTVTEKATFEFARMRSRVQPGEVVLPARLLLDVVRALPGPTVSLALRPAEQGR